MADRWFYQMLGQEFGPVEFGELESLRDAGSLSGSDKVRRDSESTCISLDDALQSGGSAVAVADSTDDSLSIDDFVIQKKEDPVPAKEKRASARAAFTPAKEVQYYIRSNGTTIGPFSPIDFCRLADAGKIEVADEVRCDDGDWRAASEFPEVMAAQMLSRGTPASSKAPPSERPAKKRKTSRKKKRPPRKRRQEADEELQGVFDEVFGPEGTLKQKETAETAPANTAVSTSDDSLEVASSTIETKPELPAVTRPAASTPPAVAPSPSAFPPPKLAQQQPVQPWKPPPKRKKSLSDRFNFDGRTLGIVGGVAGVILLCCLLPFMGMGSLFDSSLPDQASTVATINDLLSQYESAKGSDSEWVSFASDVRSTAGALVKNYREKAGLCQPRDIELKQAATSLIQLVNCRRNDSAGQEKQFANVKKAIAGES